MARDLEADLKLCEAADASASWLDRCVFADAARSGWPEAIRELMEARDLIATLGAEIESLEEYNDSLLNEIAELEEVMDNTRLEAEKKLGEARNRIKELEDDE